jgi:hypothetical protein
MSRERIEFIDEKKEKKESRKGRVREWIDGSLLASDALMKQLPFIMFLTVLAVLYIGNRYNSDRLVRKTIKLQEEAKRLKSEMISTESRLMYISKQSEVKKNIEQQGLEIKEALKPSRKIIIE